MKINMFLVWILEELPLNGLISYKGSLLKKWEITTDISNNGEMILPSIAEFITTKLNEMKIALNQVVGMGIGVPGPVDTDKVLFINVLI